MPLQRYVFTTISKSNFKPFYFLKESYKENNLPDKGDIDTNNMRKRFNRGSILSEHPPAVSTNKKNSVKEAVNTVDEAMNLPLKKSKLTTQLSPIRKNNDYVQQNQDAASKTEFDIQQNSSTNSIIDNKTLGNCMISQNKHDKGNESFDITQFNNNKELQYKAYTLFKSRFNYTLPWIKVPPKKVVLKESIMSTQELYALQSEGRDYVYCINADVQKLEAKKRGIQWFLTPQEVLDFLNNSMSVEENAPCENLAMTATESSVNRTTRNRSSTLSSMSIDVGAIEVSAANEACAVMKENITKATTTRASSGRRASTSNLIQTKESKVVTLSHSQGEQLSDLSMHDPLVPFSDSARSIGSVETSACYSISDNLHTDLKNSNTFHLLELQRLHQSLPPPAVCLSAWLPLVLYGFEHALIELFVVKLRDEVGFLTLEDLLECVQRGQFTLERFKDPVGLKLGHFNRIEKAMREFRKSTNLSETSIS